MNEKDIEKIKIHRIISCQNKRLDKLFFNKRSHICMICGSELDKSIKRIHHLNYDLVKINELIDKFYEQVYTIHPKKALSYLEELKSYIQILCKECHKKEHKNLIRNRKIIY